MSLLNAVLVLAALLLLTPALVVFIEVLSATQDRREPLPANAAAPTRARVAIVMPAHDEAAGIAAAIATVLPQLRTGDRLLVVADNCSDDTARVAAAAGASVVERQDAARRGKGYALDFGVRALAGDPPEVVVILDADCELRPGALDALVQQCTQTRRPIQALYLMHAPAGAGLGTRMAAFAWVLKNQVRALGLKNLGLPCQLMGTGMAFTWACIEAAPLASGHLVEDLQLGLDLAAAGTPPMFCPQALVTSYFPSHEDGTRAQRTRWEQGHLAVIASVGPRLVGRALRSGQTELLALALDLCVPPLAMLALLTTGGIAVTSLWAAVSGATLPLQIAVLALFLFAAAVVLAWHGYGRRLVTSAELMRAPLYVLAKIPMYLRLLTKRQTEWVRTRRDDKPQ